LKSSRFVIVAIFIIASILTPPDCVSQIGLALPLIILFYMAILIAKICNLGNPVESPSDEE
jgi:sec-independent protein translocase protein TatC